MEGTSLLLPESKEDFSEPEELEESSLLPPLGSSFLAAFEHRRQGFTAEHSPRGDITSSKTSSDSEWEGPELILPRRHLLLAMGTIAREGRQREERGARAVNGRASDRHGWVAGLIRAGW